MYNHSGVAIFETYEKQFDICEFILYQYMDRHVIKIITDLKGLSRVGLSRKKPLNW